jgi:proteasome accessory factor C
MAPGGGRVVTTKPVAEHEVHRILALVPWIVAHPGATIGEIAERFGVSAEQVERDLDLVLMIGVPPYTPDTYIDVVIDDDGHVGVRLGDFFLRPPRLSPAEGVALLAAGRALLAVPGSEPTGPLASALAKLEGALGMPDLVIDVGEPEFLSEVRDAAERAERIEIDYWSASRDARARRLVDPHAVFYVEGEWYLSAYCHQADDQRAFRVDRIRGVRHTSEGFDPPQAGDVPPVVFRPHADDVRVTLELEPAAAWVAEVYPVEQVTELGGGRLSIVLAVSQIPWLERLLLRLGPEAHLVAPEPLRSLAADAARRVIARYGR